MSLYCQVSSILDKCYIPANVKECFLKYYFSVKSHLYISALCSYFVSVKLLYESPDEYLILLQTKKSRYNCSCMCALSYLQF